MRRSYFLAGCAIAALIAVPAKAATADAPSTIAELIVTAMKREQRLVDVPAPVTVIQQRQIDALHVNDARDLFTLVPTAHLDEINAGTARDISIRGVGTPNLFSEPGVAMYLDEVYSSSYTNYPTQVYDLERVEVLRGPQGGLYGRNAVGGAVNFISKMPEDTLGGSLKGTYASYDRYELLGVLNTPVNDKIGLRFTAWRTEQNKGEYYNVITNQYLDTNDSLGGRITGKWQITPSLRLTVVGEATDAHAPGTILYFPLGGETPKTVKRDVQPVNRFDSNRIAANLTWDSSVGQFTVIGGKRFYDLHGIEDTDLTPVALRKLFRENRVESTSVEVRWLSKPLGPVTLLVGANYLDDKGLGSIDSKRLTIVDPGTSNLATLRITNDQRLESYAFFVEANWKVTDELTVIGDLRTTQDNKTDDFYYVPTPGVKPIYGNPVFAHLSKDFDRTSPGVTVQWTPSAAWNVYGKVQTGFRGGGFNFNVGALSHLPYDAETSINYEIGAKAQPWGDRAYLAATAFILEQDHVLIGQFDFSLPPGIQGFFANLGQGETKGLELEAVVKPLEGLTLSASAGFLDGKFTSGPYDGNQLPPVRPTTYALIASYQHPIVSGLSLDLNADWSYRQAGWQDAANTSHLPSASLVNLSAALVTKRLRGEIFVQNATDDKYTIAFGGFNGGPGVINNPGRRYGVSLEVRF
jgi:iron complex outermembrane receptor protein